VHRAVKMSQSPLAYSKHIGLGPIFSSVSTCLQLMSSVRRPRGRLLKNSPCRQHLSFCLQSCCAYAVPRTCYQRKTEGIVGCLWRRNGYHQPGMAFHRTMPGAPNRQLGLVWKVNPRHRHFPIGSLFDTNPTPKCLIVSEICRVASNLRTYRHVD